MSEKDERKRRFSINYSRTMQTAERPYEGLKLSLTQDFYQDETSWDQAYDLVKDWVEGKVFEGLNHRYANRRR